ncbi:MAG: hypothetical protein NT051_06690 [Candidatus Micrarchaeota archaeon]|nr:hypothetical protein [Candidatus Micrarchaeota archaeon]
MAIGDKFARMTQIAYVVLFLAIAALLVSWLGRNFDLGGTGQQVLRETGAQTAPVQNKIAECTEGQTKQCNLSDCKGTISCETGRFTECRLGRKVCIPKSRTGCNLDGCHFGLRECDSCGTGFGECLPDQENGIACDSNCS